MKVRGPKNCVNNKTDTLRLMRDYNKMFEINENVNLYAQIDFGSDKQMKGVRWWCNGKYLGATPF